MPARVVSKVPLLHEFEAWAEAQPCTTVASRLPVVIDGPASPFQVLGSLVKKHASKDEGRFYTNLRVSVVATALDGEVIEPRSVVNMVHRIHNRNSGYSDNLTKKDNVPEMPNFDSIQGATALKLDSQVEENKNDLILGKQNEIKDESIKNDPVFSGLSLDNASYFENSLDQSQDNISVFDEKSEDNATETNNNDDPDPQLFSDEDSFNNSSENNDQEISKNEDEEDFEIPAFLRNQKF